MDDLISRQAAIDEIKRFQHGAAEWRDEQKERSDIWHRADSAIASALEIGLRVKKLPSAQQWIPCSERLPEVDREILVTEKSGFIRHCEYANYGDFQEFQTVEEGLTVPDVIAWMPLPEPYKGEES